MTTFCNVVHFNPLSDMPDMMPTSLAATVVPHTGKIIKNGRVFE